MQTLFAPRRPTLPGVLLVAGLVSLLVLAATAALELWYASGRTFAQLPWVKWPLILLNLGREQTLGAWWSAALLAAAGVALVLSAGLRLAGRAGSGMLPLAGGALLIGLSFDELSALHERLAASNAQESQTAFGSPVLLAPTLLCLSALGLLAWRRLHKQVVSAVAALTWAAVAALAFVPVLEELETSLYAPMERPAWLLLLEEGTELLGGLLLLAAALLLLRSAAGDTRAVARLRETARERWWLLFNAAGILCALGTQASLSRYGDYAGDPQSGLAQWWFGSASAMVLAGTAFAARRVAPRTEARPAAALTAIGSAALVLCVAYGIDAFSWLTIADPSLDRAGRIVLALALGVGGLWLALTWRLAGLAVTLSTVVLALGHAAASAWEVGALWAAAALVFEASLLRSRPAPATIPAVVRSMTQPLPERPVEAPVEALAVAAAGGTTAPRTPAKPRKKSGKRRKPHGRR